MKNIFTDTRLLDAVAAQQFALTDDIFMENAAAALEKAVLQAVCENPGLCTDGGNARILIVAGSGDNGGDGYALARRLAGSPGLSVSVLAVKPPKSPACVRQAARAQLCGVAQSAGVEPCTVLVECISGSGFTGAPDGTLSALLEQLNAADCFRIACDVPCGLDAAGHAAGAVFHADVTVTMGALKICLFSDCAKDCTGRIVCADLGIRRSVYEAAGNCAPDAYLLDREDIRLPHRAMKNVHKGTFGHVAVVSGEKTGASIIAACAAFRFGAGLVSVVRSSGNDTAVSTPSGMLPPEIMQCRNFPEHTDAVAAGMGLGRSQSAGAAERAQAFFQWAYRYPEIPCVVDADLCYSEQLAECIETRGNLVLTPHPKEFQSLLQLCGFGTYTMEEILAQRFALAKLFSKKYPLIVLVVKGANSVIAQNGVAYINPYGRPCLAKGGSGDVLAGLTAALLAQHYSLLDAAVSASLAHALASEHIACDYAMTPFSLIDTLECL